MTRECNVQGANDLIFDELLPFIIKLALELPDLLCAPLPKLVAGREGTVSMTQRQVCSFAYRWMMIVWSLSCDLSWLACTEGTSHTDHLPSWLIFLFPFFLPHSTALSSFIHGCYRRHVC